MSVRIDKWLWATRFFKTRAIAKKAIDSGHVKINGQKSKPSRSLQLEDEVSIKKGDLKWQLTVKQLIEKRVSAKLAVLAYFEDESFAKAREKINFENKIIYKSAPKPSKNPDKKDRRALIRVKKGQL